MSTCETPLSWLVIERYQIGDLPPSEHDSVAAHLRACSDCAALLARIEADDVRPLPALAAPKAKAKAKTTPAQHAVRITATLSGLALAAGIALMVGRSHSPGENIVAERTKGEEVSFALVREDEAVFAEAGGAYRDGERFKAIVTCPPGRNLSFELAVFDESKVSFPLPQNDRIACGNGVPLAGAFRATGHDRLTVCLFWVTNGSVDRSVVGRAPPGRMSGAPCKELDPAP